MLLRGAALGECDHPPPSSPYFKEINCVNASHRVRTRLFVAAASVVA
jgi:hypothetical protein